MTAFQPYDIITPVSGSAAGNICIIADHASNHVPPGIDLRVADGAMQQHIAIDIGVADVVRALCTALGCGAVLAGVSRLVIDFNREPDSPGLIPLVSDGVAVPGNLDADVEARLAAYYRPYHAAVARTLAAIERPFIVSLHSFTPQLATRPGDRRPWDIGILYNTDDRAARLAIPMLTGGGLVVGDQLPYSGTVLNATMNLHAERRGIAYLGVELRQDHLRDEAGVRRMADLLAPTVLHCSNRLA